MGFKSWCGEESLDALERLLRERVDGHRAVACKGKLATYIPALGDADPQHLGVAMCLADGRIVAAGDADVPFTLQSVSKVPALLLALMDHGPDTVFQHVGMEPTSEPFDSILKLELRDPAKPLNPMINAGAIAVTWLVAGETAEARIARLLSFVRRLCGNDAVAINERVYRSEWETGDRNRALAYFMRAIGALPREADVEEVLAVYFQQCAIEVTCADLARLGAVLAFDGVAPWSGEQLVPREVVRIARALMVTCGLYNESGRFAVQAGIPAKSGVSGAVLAAVPKRVGVGVYGPALDDKGNSVAGLSLLTDLARVLHLSLF
ncbi:MAG TPA: glutaminase A [Calditerricola sp.]